MNTSSTKYTFTFAVIVCLICGVLLAAFSEGLRKQQELNVDLDVKKNILKAVVLKEPLPPKLPGQKALEIYHSKIEEVVVNDQGDVVEGKKPADLTADHKDLHPVYIYKEGDQVVSYAFPVIGQGLWSTLYGYLALESDGKTVRGITFYKHGETPGLGGEIEKDWFQNNFKGKKIWSDKEQRVTPIKVVKGKAADVFHDEKLDYHVDGITAATLTGNGVTDLLDKWVRIYEPFFAKVRK